MKLVDYKKIVSYIISHPSCDSRVILDETQEKFASIAKPETTNSIVRVWLSNDVTHYKKLVSYTWCYIAVYVYSFCYLFLIWITFLKMLLFPVVKPLS